MPQQIEFKENKKRTITALAVLVVLTVALIAFLQGIVFPILVKFHTLRLIVMIFAVVAPLLAGRAILKGLMSKKPVLIVDDTGITDNAAQSGVGFVPWSDVTKIKEATNFVKQKLLLFYVRNPVDYMSKTNGMKGGVLVNHYNQFGTPIAVYLFNIEHDPRELKDMIDIFFNRYQESSQPA